MDLPPLYRIAGNSGIVGKALRQCQVSQRDMALNTFTRRTQHDNQKGNDLTGDH